MGDDNYATQLRICYGKFAKRFPRFFDLSKRVSRLIGRGDPIYECLREFSRNKTRVSFLQIGSNDGISQDPLREFIVANPAWTGCFVEPLPHLFERLKRNYGYLRRANLRHENVAVSDSVGEMRLFRIKSEHHADFPSFVDQIASIDRSHITSVFPDHPGIEDKIETVKVPALSIAELAYSFRETGIDLLHLDVEGHESVILNAFPFESFHPKIIIFEEGHLSEAESASLNGFLARNDYTVYRAGIDAVALDTEHDARYGAVFFRS